MGTTGHEGDANISLIMRQWKRIPLSTKVHVFECCARFACERSEVTGTRTVDLAACSTVPV